jgi:NADH dehydrogenase FAD-containing subunit
MKHLVLLGAGPAHVHLLFMLARQPLPGVQVTLVTTQSKLLPANMLTGFVAGHYSLADCSIELAPLLKGGTVHWQQRNVVALDANARSIALDDGSCLNYDYLSINAEPVQERKILEATMPGAREHGLFVHPLEAFATLWPQVLELTSRRALRVAVIGPDVAAMELSMALRWRLPSCAVTLIAGSSEPHHQQPLNLQQRLKASLKQREVTVLADQATGIAAGEISLASGARLACDVPLVVIGVQSPSWLKESGLAMDADEAVATNKFQRSISHANVFSASQVQTMPNASALATNIRAALAGIEPSTPCVPTNRLRLLSCGERSAIANWGNFSAQGRWAWQLKSWMDARFLRQLGTL